MILKRIRIKNFKSLHDAEIKLTNFNVIVGKNSSGKTNTVDAFILLNKIYTFTDINPFGLWWGYRNAVWKQNENFPISIEFEFDIFESTNQKNKKKYTVIFETSCTGIGGKLNILKERLEIKNMLLLEREGKWLKIQYDKKYFDKFINYLNEYAIEKKIIQQRLHMPPSRETAKNILKDKNKYIQQTQELESERSILRMPFRVRTIGDYKISSFLSFPMKESADDKSVLIIAPKINKIKTFEMDFDEDAPLTLVIKNVIQNLIENMIILKINIFEMTKPYIAKKETMLLESGENLNAVLHNLFLKEGKLPKRIENLLYNHFPGVELRFSITEDQRVFIRIFENNMELPPSCTSQGLYKALAILTAIELKPSMIIIDELENSLYPDLLKYIIDELKNSNIPVIITSHSPVVIDMVDLDNIILTEKIGGQTEFKRIKNVKQLKKTLTHQGLTHSDGWLYGNLDSTS